MFDDILCWQLSRWYLHPTCYLSQQSYIETESCIIIVASWYESKQWCARSKYCLCFLCSYVCNRVLNWPQLCWSHLLKMTHQWMENFLFIVDVYIWLSVLYVDIANCCWVIFVFNFKAKNSVSLRFEENPCGQPNVLFDPVTMT